MKQTQTKTRIIIAATVLAMVSGTAAFAQMKAEDAIKARQAVMRVIALNLGPMGAMMKGDIPFDGDAFAANATRIKLLTEMPMGNYFPEGTDEGHTRALPEVWMNAEEFGAAWEEFVGNVADLAEVSAGGDADAIKAQFGKTAKNCKGCHDDFRGDEYQ